MKTSIDSYKYLSFATRRIVRAWIRREPKREIPWTAPSRPLSESTVAMVSTAALSTRDDPPFDLEGERRNPWWGDPSYRVIPHDADPQDVRVDHMHVDNRHAREDLDCAFPLRRLAQLADSGEVGRSAPSHYSFMGYLLKPDELLSRSVPAMIEQMRKEEVDVVLLVPY